MPASSKEALAGAMAANLAIAATKFIVGAITGSTVMIAEGIHSLQLGADSVMLVLGISTPPALNAGEVQTARANLAADLRKLVPTIKYVVYDPEPNRR